LRQTLGGLRRQDLAPESWELIAADNASTDRRALNSLDL
jgi:glycosyltransferase involved in cell wall biosynthesis